MIAMYLLRRGKGWQRRKAHLARYDAFGQIDGAWCDRTDFNLSSNVPWGAPRCKICLRRMAAAQEVAR